MTLEGFTVRGSGRQMDRDDAAVKLVRCIGCVVRRLTVRDPLHGIYLLESHGVDLDGNDILGAPDLMESARGNGIHLFNSSGNRLLRNRVRATRDGIYFSFASDNLVVGNEVTRARYGLHYMYSDDNRFEDNAFAENAAGAAVMFSKRIVLRRNVFARHIGYRAYGLLLQTGEDILAEGNRFEANLTALFLGRLPAEHVPVEPDHRQRHRNRPARQRGAEHLYGERIPRQPHLGAQGAGERGECLDQRRPGQRLGRSGGV